MCRNINCSFKSNRRCCFINFKWLTIKLAGALVMLGQVGDAVATPIVGVMTDRYGTKRIWHIVGTILVFLTFPLIFAVCPFCDEFPVSWKLTYLSIVILIFQFGWPVVQITHLAMIPELSRTQVCAMNFHVISIITFLLFSRGTEVISQQQGIQLQYAATS